MYHIVISAGISFFRFGSILPTFRFFHRIQGNKYMQTLNFSLHIVVVKFTVLKISEKALTMCENEYFNNYLVCQTMPFSFGSI